MRSNDKPADINDLGDKIIFGMRKALRKLAETAATNNESLVVKDKNGVVRSVPAKELLAELQLNDPKSS